MNEIQYGMPRLGQLAKFLRDFVTDDILFSQTDNVNYESQKKYWDRYCNETSTNGEAVKDYIGYAWNREENEILHLFIKFFDSEKDVPKYLETFVFVFFNSFYDSLKKFNPFPKTMEASKLPLVAENTTENYVLWNLCQSLLKLLNKIEESAGIDKAKNCISLYLNNLNYENLLSEVLIKENLSTDIIDILKKDKGTHTSAIEHLEKNAKLNNEDLYKLINCYSPNSAKNRILDIKKNNGNFTWQEIKRLCSFSSDKMKIYFKLTFFFKNLEKALKEDLFQSEESILKIKYHLKTYAETNISSEDFYSNLLKEFFSPEKRGDIFIGNKNGEAGGMLNMACASIFDKYVYKKKGKVPFEKFVDSFSDFASHTSAFFIPWFKAYISVAKCEYDRAMEYYNEAFKHKYLAGDYLVNFLEQAFCFSNYYKCDWTTTRKSYKNESGIKNPIQCDPKMFKNFGYAIGAFPDSAENSFMEAYHSFEYFYNFFPVECFVDEKAASERKETEFKNRDEIKIEFGKHDEKDFKENHAFEVLASLKDKNKLISEKSLFTLNKDHNSKQKDLCSPLYLCIKYGCKDSRLFDLAKAWIENDEELNVSAVSYNGETPLLRALKEYCWIKFNFEICIGIKLKLWNLCKLFCEKITWENELQFGKKIPTLQNAIDTCNFELVKSLAEKIPEDKFDEYKLDKTTPLIYAIKKKEIFSFGFKEYTRKQKDIHVPHSLPDYFGLTREEKTKNFMYYNPLPEDLDYTLYHMEHWENSVSEEEYLNFTALYGEEDDWEKQKKELEKIIEYFISRLKNFENQYIKQSWTSPEGDLELHLHMPLVIAAQCNDIFTAALLIEKGFELTPSFDEVGLYNETFGDKKFFLVNNFIYNLIYYKSWETLIWFLKEKKELAQTMMHNDKFNMNPLAFFAVKTRDYFIWTGKDKRDWRPLVQHIADLFINCGADPDEETVLGTARELMSFYKINM